MKNFTCDCGYNFIVSRNNVRYEITPRGYKAGLNESYWIQCPRCLKRSKVKFKDFPLILKCEIQKEKRAIRGM